MKCLRKYRWVKLNRSTLPAGKGLMGHWAKLASRAAFRPGQARYCGFTNDVSAGSWAGGIVGLKSILGIKDHRRALEIMDQLSDLGYIEYSLNPKTKKLTYKINDWVVECSGEACADGAVYATDGYGFLCLPRNITQPLIDAGKTFGESDAWLDLWCHTIWNDAQNAFSCLAPVIQYGRYGAVLTLEILGRRWGWEKTKTWRFFQKYADTFRLEKLPGSYGCLIYNVKYPSTFDSSIEDLSALSMCIIEKMRIQSKNTHFTGTDHERINQMVAWTSSKITLNTAPEAADQAIASEHDSRVAVCGLYIRAYLSPACKRYKNDMVWKDDIDTPFKFRTENSTNIRGPCCYCCRGSFYQQQGGKPNEKPT